MAPEGPRRVDVEPVAVGRYRRSSVLPGITVDPPVSDNEPSPSTERRSRARRFAVPVIVAVAVLVVAAVVFYGQSKATAWCPTNVPGGYPPSSGDYVATGTATYPTATCRFRVPHRFDVRYQTATGGVLIHAFDSAYGMGFELFVAEAQGGLGPGRVNVIEPGTPGTPRAMYTSTYGFPLPRLLRLLDIKVGASDAVPSVFGDFALTVRHPTAIRWELSIRSTGLPPPPDVPQSTLHAGALTLDVDSPTVPWQHIDLRWDAEQRDGDAHVQLHLDRQPDPNAPPPTSS